MKTSTAALFFASSAAAFGAFGKVDEKCDESTTQALAILPVTIPALVGASKLAAVSSIGAGIASCGPKAAVCVAETAAVLAFSTFSIPVKKTTAAVADAPLSVGPTSAVAAASTTSLAIEKTSSILTADAVSATPSAAIKTGSSSFGTITIVSATSPKLATVTAGANVHRLGGAVAAVAVAAALI